MSSYKNFNRHAPYQIVMVHFGYADDSDIHRGGQIPA